MTHGPRYIVKTRRRRKGITDYKKRLRLLRSHKTRIVIRKSNKHIRVQFVEYDETGDKIICSAISKELEGKYNWKHSTSSTPAAYLTGLIAGKKASKEKIDEGVLDIGRQVPTKAGVLFAAVKGVVDAGVDVSYDENKIPDEKRIKGEHIDEKISSSFDKIKKEITGGK